MVGLLVGVVVVVLNSPVTASPPNAEETEYNAMRFSHNCYSYAVTDQATAMQDKAGKC